MLFSLSIFTFIFALALASPAPSSSCQFGDDTAFLFFDFQLAILSSLPNSTPKTNLLNNVASLLEAVRSVQHGDVSKAQPRLPLIVHSQVLFTPGYPEVSACLQLDKALTSSSLTRVSSRYQLSLNNPFFSRLPSVYNVTVGSPTVAFTPSLQPDISNGEVVVQKTRFNSALRTNLVTALESQSIKKVVLSGYQITGAILSTSTYLSDLDYQVYVVEDNVLDPGDLSPTDPNELVTIYNGTTLSSTVLNVVLRDFVTTLSLKDIKAGLCKP